MYAEPYVQCRHCGKKMPADTRYRVCQKCGRPLDGTQPSPGGAEDPTPVPDEPLVVEPVRPDHEDAGDSTETGIRLEVQLPASIDAPHWYFPFRLTNLAERVIRRVSLSVVSTLFSDRQEPLVREWDVYLSVGGATKTSHCEFDVRSRDGLYPVEIEGWYLDVKGNPYAFRGNFDIDLSQREENPSKTFIKVTNGGLLSAKNIDPRGSLRLKVENAGVADFDHVGATRTDKTTLQWVHLGLERNPDKTHMLRALRESKRARKRPVATEEPSLDRQNRPLKAILSVRTEKDFKIVHIWTGRICRMGRDPAAVDLTAVLLPCTAENTERSNYISKRHSLLRIGRHRVKIENLESRNGTFVNGHSVTSSRELSDGQVLCLANVITFRYRDFRRIDQTRQGKQLLATCSTLNDCSQALSSTAIERAKQQAPLEAFRLERLDDYRDRIEYLFLRVSATIGSAADAAVRVAHASVSEYHARLVRIKGRFFIEDLNSINGTRVGGTRLEPYERQLLQDRSTIVIGDVELTLHIVEVSQ